MTNSSLNKKFEVFKKEFDQISKLISLPNIIYNKKKYHKLLKQYKKIEKWINYYNEYNNKLSYLNELNSILEHDTDPEMINIASAEKKNILEEILYFKNKLNHTFSSSSQSQNINDNNRNAIVELRSGTGGNEACLFVEEILRMYIMYFKQMHWKYKIMHAQKSGSTGYKEIILEVSSGSNNKDNVYGNLKFESGVHRVQRIPKTESQGRIHTSAITVAVLPEIQELEMKINLTDIKKETFRSSGAGGQHVNKTESAVRLTHIPSKITVECQEERSQHKNFEKAMNVLRARLFQQEMNKRCQERSFQRKCLISTGDRSVKIRTYNYPNKRVTDHRVKKSIYDITGFMNGNIQKMIDCLKEKYIQ
nr:peptide chain release factor 1 [Blattabacterium cuenoti]